MNIINKIKKFFKSIKDCYKLAKEDKVNKKQFIEQVKSELNNRNSFFSQYNIKVDNDNYTQIVYNINIPPEFQFAGQDWQIKDKLDENAYIVSRFLRINWGYNDNIIGPEYYHIEDPTDMNVSTRYIAVWNFTNKLQSKKPIYIINTISSIILVGLITTIICLCIL